uniref:Uncharacterized protein n=1 Tax=Hyaloperonospora arabidopsidis (strain Emoy2) TaxID=559515 RepID=M4BSZ4_HYAAE
MAQHVSQKKTSLIRSPFGECIVVDRISLDGRRDTYNPARSLPLQTRSISKMTCAVYRRGNGSNTLENQCRAIIANISVSGASLPL